MHSLSVQLKFAHSTSYPAAQLFMGCFRLLIVESGKSHSAGELSSGKEAT